MFPFTYPVSILIPGDLGVHVSLPWELCGDGEKKGNHTDFQCSGFSRF